MYNFFFLWHQRNNLNSKHCQTPNNGIHMENIQVIFFLIILKQERDIMSGSCVAEKHYTMQTVDRCDREYGANTTEIMCKATSNFEYYGYVGNGKYFVRSQCIQKSFQRDCYQKMTLKNAFCSVIKMCQVMQTKSSSQK